MDDADRLIAYFGIGILCLCFTANVHWVIVEILVVSLIVHLRQSERG